MDVYRKHISQVVEGLNLLDRGEYESVFLAFDLVKGWGGTVYTCGNGGSSALASHLVNDLVKMCKVRAICLSDNVPTMTAYGNDDGWSEMYVRQLIGMMGEEDMVFGISTSGESMNVIRAMEYADGHDWLVAGLTGCSIESEINKVAKNALMHTAGVADIRVVEDLHTIVCHTLVRDLQERL